MAAEVGVNIATLHYYFRTKEALIRAVVDHAMTRFRTTLVPGGSPGEQLEGHLHGVRRLFREEPELFAVMGELAQRSARDPAIAAIFKETNDTWHAALRGILRRAQAEGYLDAGLDPDATAALVTATFEECSCCRLKQPHRSGWSSPWPSSNGSWASGSAPGVPERKSYAALATRFRAARFNNASTAASSALNLRPSVERSWSNAESIAPSRYVSITAGCT